jgi:hypothetical protein
LADRPVDRGAAVRHEEASNISGDVASASGFSQGLDDIIPRSRN